MLRMTIDANVFHELFGEGRTHHADAVRLFALAREGRVELVATTRIDMDVPREPLRSQIAAFNVAPAGTAFFLEGTRRDRALPPVSQEEEARARRLMNLLFPQAQPSSPKQRNRVADVDHLLGHLASGNDYFVTLDHGILGRAGKLLDEGIAVVPLADAVALAESA